MCGNRTSGSTPGWHYISNSTDGATVARTLAQTVQHMRDTQPQLKIVVSEITPRKEYNDDQVKICNEHIHAYFEPMQNVTMAIHSNLRTANWKYHEDDKHFLKESIAKFAANIKIALRKAIGIPERTKKVNKSKVDDAGELRRKLMAVLQGKY